LSPRAKREGERRVFARILPDELAVDLNQTLREVEGAEAVRASIALPGIFRPARLGGKCKRKPDALRQ
jgi:predicted acylesterase/phospholipase RssA